MFFDEVNGCQLNYVRPVFLKVNPNCTTDTHFFVVGGGGGVGNVSICHDMTPPPLLLKLMII